MKVVVKSELRLATVGASIPLSAARVSTATLALFPFRGHHARVCPPGARAPTTSDDLRAQCLLLSLWPHPRMEARTVRRAPGPRRAQVLAARDPRGRQLLHAFYDVAAVVHPSGARCDKQPGVEHVDVVRRVGRD